MTLLTIAEVMAGELLVSPGGLVDRVTASGDDVTTWEHGTAVLEPALTAHVPERSLVTV